MAKNTDTRLRMLHLLRYLYEFTDAEHPATLKMIEQALEIQEFTIGRKGIDADIFTIQRYNHDFIKKVKMQNVNYYYWDKRTFSLAEIKILIEAIQASRVLTEEQSLGLIKKLESLIVHHDRTELQNQIYIYGRPKPVNENVFSNVLLIHQAILQNKKIRFHYMQWANNKNLVEKRNGAWYSNSPYFLAQDQEKLYLIVYDAEEFKKKHFRVDKMKDVEILSEARVGQAYMSRINIAKYTNQNFGMFSGKLTTVKFLFHNELMGVAFDRFGREINIRSFDKNRFVFSAEVMTSVQFYGFIFGLGAKAKILSPDWVVDEYQKLINENRNNYL